MEKSVGVRKSKPHAVCVPFPAQGHVNPLMQLSKLLHSKGFHITFVNTEFNHARLIRSSGPESVKGLPDFRFEAIPDGLPPPATCDETRDVPSLCDSTRKNCFSPFKELLEKLNSSSSSGVPPVSCVISDGVMSFGMKAAEELGIPQVQFWTASACSFLGYLNFNELERRRIMPYKVEDFLNDAISETPIDWIPGLTNIRLKDTPLFIGTSNDEIMYDFMGSETLNCLKSSAIILNTFDEFESEALQAISDKFPREIYTIGPLNLLVEQMPESESKSLVLSLWKEGSNCLEWLDKRGPKSVVYVNYGSVSFIKEKHLKEFAWGLANSKNPFLWIVRQDLISGESAILPEEFIEQTKDRGMLASWCQQDQVLAHPSVGVFVTHCGWNSTMEAVSSGVPMICWPFFADQQTNCRYACTKWGNGVEVNHEVKREDVEVLVKEMMEGNGGKEKRKMALEWKRKAEEAVNNGGSSHSDFSRFIKEALHYDEQLME